MMTAPLQYTNMSDLLTASPFDPEQDLNEWLTEERFFEHFHVNLGRMEQLSARLQNIIEGTAAPDRVIFMKGFPGNGKTTFVKNFIRTTQALYRHVYFDIQQQRGVVPPGVSPAGTDRDEVQLLINRVLRQMSGAADSFLQLYEHREILREEDFISSKLHAWLEEHPPEASIDSRYLLRCTDAFDLKDTFAVLFVHLFHTAVPGQKTIVYFDNLDAARLAYISETFLVYFQNAVIAALPIARHQLFAEQVVDFRTDFRFIFTLRDANEATLNAHLFSTRFALHRTPFEVRFDPESYKQVIERRIDVLASNTVNTKAAADAARFSVLGLILRDDYFHEVLLPLYNNDYREVASMLVRVIDRHNIVPNEEKKLGPRTRGALPFGVIQDLIETNFLKEYKHVSPYEGGYCFIDRVMLTVLINASRYKRARKHSDDWIDPEESEPYSLLTLVRELDRVYHDVKTILDAIARCFLWHKKNWTHLITLEGWPVEDHARFVDRYLPLFKESVSEQSNRNTIVIQNELHKLVVRVNPAGFTYVRYILSHFEFYSNISGNKSSLFDEPLKRDERGQYAFETKLGKVLNTVRTHVNDMRNFFFTRYVAAKLTPGFSRSDFAFRHPGLSRLPKDQGMSHTIRVTTAHIGYIDYFRRSLLADPTLDDREKRRIHESITSTIEQYVSLLRLAPDADVAREFAGDFEASIREASASNASYTTPISTPLSTDRDGGLATPR